jgi:uncharacterized membrane protein YgaE (UPF0421/DUF939 family)
MKNQKVILAVFGSVAGVFLSSCQSKEKKLENAQENVVEANEDLDKAQQEYRMEQENRLHENEMEIETYRNNEKELKEDIRADYHRMVDSLEARNKNLRIKLNTYDKKDKDNTRWESFKREFNHDMEELKNSFKDIGKNNVK